MTDTHLRVDCSTGDVTRPALTGPEQAARAAQLARAQDQVRAQVAAVQAKADLRLKAEGTVAVLRDVSVNAGKYDSAQLAKAVSVSAEACLALARLSVGLLKDSDLPPAEPPNTKVINNRITATIGAERRARARMRRASNATRT